MRNISFALTTEQVRSKTKTVTRRTGWKHLKAGTLLQPVVKGMGLKRGEKVEKIGGPIRVIDVRLERLDRLEEESVYGEAECRAEGFPNLSPMEFVAMFCASHTIPDTRPFGLPRKRRQPFPMLPCDEVTRIEFEYPLAPAVAPPRMEANAGPPYPAPRTQE